MLQTILTEGRSRGGPVTALTSARVGWLGAHAHRGRCLLVLAIDNLRPQGVGWVRPSEILAAKSNPKQKKTCMEMLGRGCHSASLRVMLEWLAPRGWLITRNRFECIPVVLHPSCPKEKTVVNWTEGECNLYSTSCTRPLLLYPSYPTVQLKLNCTLGQLGYRSSGMIPVELGNSTWL